MITDLAGMDRRRRRRKKEERRRFSRSLMAILVSVLGVIERAV